MKIKLISLLAMAVIAVLLFSGIMLANGEPPVEPPERPNSVSITVGGETMTNVAVGQVLHERERAASRAEGDDGSNCTSAVPGVTINFSGDVSKVKVGLAPEQGHFESRSVLDSRPWELRSSRARVPNGGAGSLSHLGFHDDVSGPSKRNKGP